MRCIKGKKKKQKLVFSSKRASSENTRGNQAERLALERAEACVCVCVFLKGFSFFLSFVFTGFFSRKGVLFFFSPNESKGQLGKVIWKTPTVQTQEILYQTESEQSPSSTSSDKYVHSCDSASDRSVSRHRRLLERAANQSKARPEESACQSGRRKTLQTGRRTETR